MEVKLRPITTLWQDTWDLFVVHIGNLVLLALLPQIVVTLIGFLFGGGLLTAVTISDSALFGTFGSTAAVIVLSIVTILIQLLGLFSMVVYLIHHKTSPNLKSTYALTLQFFWRYLGLAAIITLITGAITFVCVVIITVISGLVGLGFSVESFDSMGWIMALGLLISAIPGGIFGIYANFGSYFLVDRKIGPWQALKASLRSVHKNFWTVFLRLFLFMVVLFGAGIVLSIIPMFGQLISIVILTPIVAVYYFELYQDLKKHP